MHMQTDLLHDIGDVGPCERQVLKISCNTPKLRGVVNRRPRVLSQLCLEVDWSRAWLAVRHYRTLKDVLRVGTLVKEQPLWMTLDGDAESGEAARRPSWRIPAEERKWCDVEAPCWTQSG
jgi:hypothetical protein